jgi:RNA polymerase sigma-70 factor (ECF subfamily)
MAPAFNDPDQPPPDSAESDPVAHDAALIARARAGEERAFGELMQAHYPATFRLVVAILRHEHDARDVCQEVWLTVWKTLPTYRGESRFSTWLHPIATRRAIDHLRKRRRWFSRFLPFSTGPDDRLGVPEPPSAVDTPADFAAAERRARFEKALAELPPLLRAALALREIEGQTYEQIARSLECPVGTVMSRLHKARHLLAKKLQSSRP